VVGIARACASYPVQLVVLVLLNIAAHMAYEHCEETALFSSGDNCW
jgi:hypothetical protein